jgi:hypothetical protein
MHVMARHSETEQLTLQHLLSCYVHVSEDFLAFIVLLSSAKAFTARQINTFRAVRKISDLEVLKTNFLSPITIQV